MSNNSKRRLKKSSLGIVVSASAVLLLSVEDASALVSMSGPFSNPEWFGQQNYVYSPLPEVCTGTDTRGSGGHCTGTELVGTLAGGLHKFVDSLPLLGVDGCGTGGANNLGECLSVALPDKTSFGARTASNRLGQAMNLPDTDYYSLESKEYAIQMHSDLQDPTWLRGYRQLATAGNPNPDSGMHYLSPFILAAKGRPTRIKFKNSIQDEIPLPVDQSYWGAGSVDYNGNSITPKNGNIASTKRTTVHLHGGDNPWISDGTPHTWITPAGDQTGGTGSGYQKGVAFQNAPDMVTNGWLMASNTCGATDPNECFSEGMSDGMASYYYPNGQTSRLMFYHDHAFGITRLNVYQGLAAGYLLADWRQEEALASLGVPGWITVDHTLTPTPTDPTNQRIDGVNLGKSDLAHLVPLVIQDKTFVPDNGEPGGQLALQDPTWPAPSNSNATTDYSGPTKYWLTANGSRTDGWGRSQLWLPHVYTTNQLPKAVSVDINGNPITPSTVAPLGRWDFAPWMGAPLQVNFPPVNCQTTAYPGQPFTCPAMKNPMAVPESFMDTITVNGTVYPHVDLDSSAYRFKILNAANDRFFNMGFYVAVTQDPIVNIVDTTVNPVNGPGMGATADATVTSGSVTGLSVADAGVNYPPSITTGLSDGINTSATAYAIVDASRIVQKLVVNNPGSGYTDGSTVTDGWGNTWTATVDGNGAITSLAILNNTVPTDPQEVSKVAVRVTYGLKPGDLTALGVSEATGFAAVNDAGEVIDFYLNNAGANFIAGGTRCENIDPALVALCTEVKQVYPQVYDSHTQPKLCSGSTSLLPGLDNLGLVHVPDLRLGRTGMSSTCWPDTWPSDGSAHSGMVPDPRYAGPPIIQLGNEGGLLPDPVIIPSTPINYIYNRKMAVLNGFTGGHGLDLAPAQRADVVVDFHAFQPASGKQTVIILYNDHPAPAPLFDTRYDMYTGDPDQSDAGGAPMTLPGFAPNTRTMLQVRLSNGSTNNSLNIPNLQSLATGVPALFASTQDKIIVPEPEYPQNGLPKQGGGSDPGNGYAPSYTVGTFYTVQMPNSDSGSIGGIDVTKGGSYRQQPAVAIDAPPAGGTTAQAAAILAGTASVESLTLGSGGSGYSTFPTVTLTGGGGTGASFTAVLAPTTIQSVTLTNSGSGYPLPQTLSGLVNDVRDGTTVVTCTGCSTSAGGLTSVAVTAGGLYTGNTAPSLTVGAPNLGGGTQATAAAALAARGGLVSVTPTNTKICNNFTGTRSVNINATGVTTRATATANIRNGVVTSVVVTAPGNGYPLTGLSATISNCSAPKNWTYVVGRPIASVTVNTKGSGYTANPSVTAPSGQTVGGTTYTASLTGVASGYITGFNQVQIISAFGTPTTVASSVLTVPGSANPAQLAVTLNSTSIASFNKISGGSGYTTAPTVNITGGGGSGATATAVLSPRPIQSFTVTNAGSGYTSVPFVQVSPGINNDLTTNGTGAAFMKPVVTDFKGIIEGFDPIWGTLNVELGDSVPAPGTNVNQNYLVAAALPFGYVDPPSEIMDSGVHNWRIDHIGVDAHSLHFHLFNVQVINYLDIAGQIYMPDSNQLGWNEALRTEPFTSVFVAMRSIKPQVPWELPNSIHPIDPTTTLGTVNGPVGCINNPFALQALVGPNCVPFTQVDPTANAVNITNALVNYGWEYVYHCHLLSHEEHDMMRPISFVVAPQNAPQLTRVNGSTLRVTDKSFNETNFVIERTTNATANNPTWTPFATVTTGTGSTRGTGVNGTVDVAAPNAGTSTQYRAVAANIVGCNASVPALSNGAQIATPPACSDIFTGWPGMTARSPVSNSVQ